MREADLTGFARGFDYEFAVREWQMGAENCGSGTWFGARRFCQIAKSRSLQGLVSVQK